MGAAAESNVVLPFPRPQQAPMIAYWDADRRNEYCSESYLRRFGLDRAVVGELISDVTGPEKPDLEMPYVTAVLSGERQVFDRTTVRPDGTVSWCEVDYVPYWHGGRIVGFCAEVVDITVRVEQDAALVARAQPVVRTRERHRVADGLHAGVLQSLYGAGLHLTALLDVDLEARDIARLVSAIDSVDAALAGLRAIDVRAQRTDPADIEAAIRSIAARSGVTLGFAPTVEIDGLEALHLDIAEDLLTALGDALTSLADHGHASWANVGVTAKDGWVRVEIAADGRSVVRLERAAGLADTRARAEQVGGTLTWRNNVPCGTVLVWTVPVGTTDVRPPA